MVNGHVGMEVSLHANQEIVLDGPFPPYILDVRPSQEFAYEAGKRKLVEIQTPTQQLEFDFAVPGEEDPNVQGVGDIGSGFTGRQGKLLRLASCVDLESELSVGCAGAVLTYIKRRRAAGALPGNEDTNEAWRIREVEMFTLDGTMFVVCATLPSWLSNNLPGISIWTHCHLFRY